MTLRLPAEIWADILAYLTNDELRAFAYLNSHFFEAYLDAEYRILHIPCHPSKLYRASEAYIAKRIVSLHLELEPLDNWFASQATSTGRIRPIPDFFFPRVDAFDMILFIAGRSSKLHHLTISMTSPAEGDGEFLSELWFIIHSKLRSMTIQMAAPHCLSIFSAFRESPPSLASVCISSITKLTSHDIDATTHLVEFLRGASASVTCLDINIHGGRKLLSHLYRSLAPFPRIRSARLRVPCDDATMRDLKRLINNPLDELSLTFKESARRRSITSPLSMLNTENLRILDLDVPPKASKAELLPRLLTDMSRSKSLEYFRLSIALEPKEFDAVISSLAGSDCAQTLRHLVLSPRSITAATMDSLCSAFPFLHKLSLSVVSIGDWHLGADYAMHQFVKQMLVRDYSSSWALYDLNITEVSDTILEDAVSDDWGGSTPPLIAMRAIARCTPSIQRFNGNPISSYVLPGDHHWTGSTHQRNVFQLY